MQQKIYRLKGDDILEPVNEFVRSHYQEAYESAYEGGYLRMYEDYSILNGNDIMVCIRVDTSSAASGHIVIEIISGGGSDNPITGEFLGSENRRIKGFTKSLETFCESRHIILDAE